MQVGDIGVKFEGTILFDGLTNDISDATLIEIIYLSPLGIKKTKTGALSTDGTDSKVKYVTIANDIDTHGAWMWHWRIVRPSGEWHTDVKTFTVGKNL